MFKILKIMLSTTDTGKIDNRSICDNSACLVDFTLTSTTLLYTPNIIRIIEIDGKFHASTRTPYQPRNILNVQTQIILSCKHFLFSLISGDTVSFSNVIIILD